MNRSGDGRVLTPEQCRAIGERLLDALDTPRGAVSFSSSVSTRTTFARGRPQMASETETTHVTLTAGEENRFGTAHTNRLDERGLQQLVHAAQMAAQDHRSTMTADFLEPETYPEGPRIHFDSVVSALDAGVQAELLRSANESAQDAGLVSASDVWLFDRSRATINTRGLWAYDRSTFGEFSMTARTPDGTGSGWAWGGYEDWGRVDTAEVMMRAIALGRRSANPVAVEPGRYTVILEPAAVAALVQPILWFWDAERADRGASVFSGDTSGTNRIGQQMLDRRLNMVSDPWDPERPGSTKTPAWTPIPEPVQWFENGVLRNLEYTRNYVRITGGDPVINPGGVRLTAEGEPVSLEEMVASTRRGIWVNRLSNVSLMNPMTVLASGTTQDGTFLIENGQITRPVKNFRFTESPFYVLNRFEAAGVPVRASQQIVAPRMKVGDFNFTSLTDAI